MRLMRDQKAQYKWPCERSKGKPTAPKDSSFNTFTLILKESRLFHLRQRRRVSRNV